VYHPISYLLYGPIDINTNLPTTMLGNLRERGSNILICLTTINPEKLDKSASIQGLYCDLERKFKQYISLECSGQGGLPAGGNLSRIH